MFLIQNVQQSVQPSCMKHHAYLSVVCKHYVLELQQRLDLAFRSLLVASSNMRLHQEKGANDHIFLVSIYYRTFSIMFVIFKS